jgi:hypothetical protein
MLTPYNLVHNKCYRIRFKNGQELDVKFTKIDHWNNDCRLKFIIPNVAILRVFANKISAIVSEIPYMKGNKENG